MMTFARDLRLAARSMMKNPGFSATAILTLALGMTLCTLAIVLTRGYLLRNLPYPAAERLYTVRYSTPGQDQPREMQRLDWSSLADVIEQPIAWDLDVFYLLGGPDAEPVPGAWVTRGFVEGLGIEPALGRGFDDEAFAAGSANVALISHRLWTSRYAASASAIGSTFTAYVSDRPAEAERFTIVGVLAADFWHINPFTDVIVPLRAPAFPYMVRLREGVSAAAAAARITSLVAAGAREVPRDWRADLSPARDAYVQSVRPTLQALIVAAGLVLAVACANVAGLLLIRATRRQHEIAVRTALGAGRGAIARLLLAEGVLLGGAATAVALGATNLVLRSLAPVLQRQLGRPAPGGEAAFAIDLAILAIASFIGVLTAVVCTLAAAATAFRPGGQRSLHAASRTATDGRRGRRARGTLVVLEIAASLALLTGSALMVRSVVGLLQTDLGFDGSRVINASITLRQNRYPEAAGRAAAFERIVERLGALPGADAAGLTTAWPIQQPRLQSIGRDGEPNAAAARAAVQAVSDEYFSTLRIAQVSGRVFTPGDRIGSEPVAIVSATLARRLWPAADPVGRRIVVPQDREGEEPARIVRTVVGIVRDVRQGPADVELADVYVPSRQAPSRFAFVLLRTAGAPEGMLDAFRSAFREIDPEIAVFRAGPLQARVDEVVSGPRFLASLLSAFGATAALLTLVGVYSVIAYAVRQREREIAVRMALGADPATLTRLFVRQGAVLLLAGLALGAIGAFGAGRLIESQLFGVTARDPLALTSAAVALASAGLLAIWWPSRRAAATDPALALRE